jgi:hypothetical protein
VTDKEVMLIGEHDFLFVHQEFFQDQRKRFLIEENVDLFTTDEVHDRFFVERQPGVQNPVDERQLVIGNVDKSRHTDPVDKVPDGGMQIFARLGSPEMAMLNNVITFFFEKMVQGIGISMMDLHGTAKITSVIG